MKQREVIMEQNIWTPVTVECVVEESSHTYYISKFEAAGGASNLLNCFSPIKATQGASPGKVPPLCGKQHLLAVSPAEDEAVWGFDGAFSFKL